MQTKKKYLGENFVKVGLIDSIFVEMMKNCESKTEVIRYGIASKLLKNDLLIAPVCEHGHWYLVVIDQCQKLALVMDSLNSENNSGLETVFFFIMCVFLKQFTRNALT